MTEEIKDIDDFIETGTFKDELLRNLTHLKASLHMISKAVNKRNDPILVQSPNDSKIKQTIEEIQSSIDAEFKKIHETLGTMKPTKQEKKTYDFTIKRDKNNLITEVCAKQS